MTEQSRDPSDHSGSLDGELVVALTQVDVVIEKYIRKAIGDYEYDAYEARTALENDLMTRWVRRCNERSVNRLIAS